MSYSSLFGSKAATAARWAATGLAIAIPVSIALDNLLLALLLAFWLASGDYAGKWRQLRSNPVALAALAIFAMMLLQSLRDPAQYAAARDMLGKYLDFIFVPIFITLFTDARQRTRTLRMFLGVMFLTLVLSWLLWLGLAPFLHHLHDGTARNAMVFKSHIDQSLLMGIAAFAFAMLALETPNRWRRTGLFVIAALCAFNILFMVEGRTGYLALAALIAYYFGRRLGARGVAIAVLVIAALGAGAYTASPLFHQRMDRMVTEISEFQPGKPVAITDSSGLRLQFYLNTLQIIKAHPLFGVGTGGFDAAYAKLAAAVPGEIATRNPHNTYLLFAAQFGLAGLILLFYYFALVWQSAGKLARPFEQALMRAVLVAIAVGSLGNSFLLDHMPGLFFAWMAGLLCAGLNTLPASSASGSEPAEWPPHLRADHQKQRSEAIETYRESPSL